MTKNRPESPEAGAAEGVKADVAGDNSGEPLDLAEITIFDVQKALHRLMRRYPNGGIKGIWQDIDSCYKYPDNAGFEGFKGEYNNRIKKEAFIRAVGHPISVKPSSAVCVFSV
jgi:hypothetical protein